MKQRILHKLLEERFKASVLFYKIDDNCFIYEEVGGDGGKGNCMTLIKDGICMAAKKYE